ncbi:MAG: hypothetical protein QOE79_2096 [Sphingomonadales bacterium]|jgi:hypothetical protein|nr:hypothetical protein [Sphingomonadales bacterium]
MILAAWLLLAAPVLEARSADEAARQLAACGFPERSVRIGEDALLEEEVVAVGAGAASPSERQLGCAARASLATSVDLQFDSARTGTRYGRSYDALSRASALAESRRWLAERGLLGRLPAWDGTPEDLPTAAAGIERLCGLEPGSRFLLRFGVLTLRAEWFEGETGSDELLCLARAVYAAGLQSGFIGNERTGRTVAASAIMPAAARPNPLAPDKAARPPPHRCRCNSRRLDPSFLTAAPGRTSARPARWYRGRQ